MIVVLKPDTIDIAAIMMMMASIIPKVAIFSVNADDSAEPVRYRRSFFDINSSNLINRGVRKIVGT